MGEVIPYNIDLVNKARDFRKNPTHAEAMMWRNMLEKKQLLGYKFTRQKPLNEFIVDFYCSRLLLAIEIDGEYHKFEIPRDEVRTDILKSYNVTVLRFKNDEVINNIKQVRRKLIEIIKKRGNELGLTPLVPLDRGK